MPGIFWITRTLEQVPPNNDWLSEAEQQVLAGFRFQKRRNDWLLGRWTAKQAILARRLTLDFPPQSIEIRAEAATSAPKAFISGKPSGGVISISHSRNRCLCAVCGAAIELGVDLEWIEPREENFAADYFMTEEMETVLNAPVDSAVVTNLIWSAKESVLKALRKGLSLDTRSVLIRPGFSGPDDSWNSWTGHCIESSRLFHGWWRTAGGFVYTIASDQPADDPQEIL
jgi:4'-phosphopantetheinyl transferase